jgi:hypothetical protein
MSVGERDGIEIAGSAIQALEQFPEPVGPDSFRDHRSVQTIEMGGRLAIREDAKSLAGTLVPHRRSSANHDQVHP